MTWIKTFPVTATEELQQAFSRQRTMYPIEYATPVPAVPEDPASGIVASHSLIPDALYHAFATFGVLMSPDLPLERRQHEMIATLVSETNRCRY